jgi:hypothetical protein
MFIRSKQRDRNRVGTRASGFQQLLMAAKLRPRN